MPSGPTPPNPSELLRSQKMQDLVEVLEESFDLVIFDMPPVVTVTDAQILSAYVDGTILVIRERATKKQAVIEAKKMLDAAERTGKKLTIGYQNRFRADSLATYDACSKGELGEIYFAKAHAVRRKGVPTWGAFPYKEKLREGDGEC